MLNSLRLVATLLLSIVSSGSTETYNEVKDSLPERPVYRGVMGTFLNFPGLRYEPNLPSVEGLVHFTYRKNSTYEKFVNRLNSFLQRYDAFEQFGENVIDCGVFRGYRPTDTWEKTCRYDLVTLGDACVRQNNYGYREGNPCFFLSLERILNWLPEPYKNETVPAKIRNEWSMYAVTVHCEGEDPISKDNIGTIKYYPPEGFSFKYFPNTGQAEWISPLVAVQLEHSTIGVVVRVACTAYAKNMKQDERLNTGKVVFEVLVD